MMMESLDAWRSFFGWCTVLNVGFYAFTVVSVLTMRGWMARLNRTWYGVSEDLVLTTTFQWVAAYKLAIILFALVPWLALVITT